MQAFQVEQIVDAALEKERKRLRGVVKVAMCGLSSFSSRPVTAADLYEVLMTLRDGLGDDE